HDPTLLDDALARKVVLCSPTTLFAVLAVIRQAVDRVALERVSDEILQLLAGFADQWERFVAAMDKVGRGLETTTRAYEALATTRRGQLEKQLQRIDELRRDRGVEAVVTASTRPRLVALGDDAPDVDDGPDAGDAEDTAMTRDAANVVPRPEHPTRGA
ncbi:MAG: DNA recombination protein RmuC, partial [Actinomycetota bacterium]